MADKLKLKILYVEDEQKLRERIGLMLGMCFGTVLTAANGEEAVRIFLQERPDLVVSDIRMPVMDGLEMTRAIRLVEPKVPVIFCTAFTEAGYLLKAIELGVSAYVRKPLDCEQLIEVIKESAAPILARVELAEARAREQASLELLLGQSPAMEQVIRQAQQIAVTDYSTMLQGETGVGKSHLALLIHNLSGRKTRPFVTVNLSSLPESLAESELFGHTKGAFTGADTAKKGLFEEAHGGTLFLDDVDCANPAIQAKILHAVEQKRFYPVGGTRTVALDTRIIAATNRDLLQEAHQGKFRQDLYYRLSDLVIAIPPLRERGADLEFLARGFLSEVALELGRTPPRLSPEAVALLHRHPWPGNVRELKSTMKRVAVFCGESVGAEELAASLGRLPEAPAGAQAEGAGERPKTFEEAQRQALVEALAAAGGKKMEAARLLALDYNRFKRMIDKYRLG
jgi:DNA-binding NtrC family response regulator